MRGLFHKSSLLCFYRTSGRSNHKYNSSIAPTELEHAARNSAAMSTSSKSSLYGCPITCLSQCHLNFLCLVHHALSRPTNRCIRNLQKFSHCLLRRVMTITSVQVYQRATPPTRKRSVQISKFLPSSDSSLHDTCATGNNGVVIELRRVRNVSMSLGHLPLAFSVAPRVSTS
jgi:hypothetical protein